MAKFALFSTLTTEGRQSLHHNPGRINDVNKEIEKLGCKVVAQSALLGASDFLTIIEARDSVAAAHLSLDVGSRGTVLIKTVPIVEVADLQKALHGAAHIARAGAP